MPPKVTDTALVWLSQNMIFSELCVHIRYQAVKIYSWQVEGLYNLKVTCYQSAIKKRIVMQGSMLYIEVL